MNEPQHSPPSYEIAHVRDFLKVPKDRLPDCLAEFADFLAMARNFTAAITKAGPLIGFQSTPPELKSFTWIDDKHKFRTVNLEIQVSAHNGDFNQLVQPPEAQQ